MVRASSSIVDRRQMLYLNFEDDRLLPIKSRELDLITQAHAELYAEFAQRKKYIFFDEVQNAPRWETYVRRLHDTEEAQIFLTGSSSHLLVREPATGLRGRSISESLGFLTAFVQCLICKAVELLSFIIFFLRTINICKSYSSKNQTFIAGCSLFRVLYR